MWLPPLSAKALVLFAAGRASFCCMRSLYHTIQYISTIIEGVSSLCYTCAGQFKPFKGGDVPMKTDEPMLSTDEVAAWLRVDRRTVAGLAADKKIPVYRVGRKLRFIRAEVA